MLEFPAGIDIHVHFREPGFEHKEDMQSGMKAAKSGGITTVIDMPNTNPVTTDVRSLKLKKEKAAKYHGLYIAAAMTDSSVNNGQLKKMTWHTPIFKAFLANSTGNLGISKNDFEKGMDILSEGRNLLMVHAEDPAFLKNRTINSLELDVRPEIAEVESIKYVLETASDYSNLKVHITHVSTFEGAKLLLKQNLVSWDVLPKYFDFNTTEVIKKGNFAKMNPPLRSESSQKGMLELLLKGKIPIVASDHAPHTIPEKENIVAGAPGVQELYLSLIDKYVKKKLTRKTIENIIFNNPKELLNSVGIQPVEGKILVNPEEVTIMNEETIQSKCGWSLWSKFQGKIIETIVYQ